jgi:hypothetical protein
MLRLDNALRAWGTADFEAVFKQELARNADLLPLQNGLSLSSLVAEAPISVVVYLVQEQADSIIVKTGIFYLGVDGGCSCADDPTPVSENTEYCVLLLEIDRASARTTVRLLTE